MDERQASAAAGEQARKRSDPRVRRRALRGLDLVFTDEIRDAGAVSLEELIEMAARPLRGEASSETINEWWRYARRRSWLEEYESGRWRLTSRGEDEVREIRRRGSQPDPVEGAKAIVRWGFPAGVFGAVAFLGGKSLTAAIAVLVICGTIAASLLIAALVVWFVDPPFDRWLARRACEWLDGRRVRLWIRTVPAAEGKVVRLYEEEPVEGEVSPVASAASP